MPLALRHGAWLQESNPWWSHGEAMAHDRHVMAWLATEARHVPALFGDLRGGLDAASTVLYTVHGPRQAGKTTLAKLLMRDLLASGVPPQCLCYLSLSRGLATQDLVLIMREYLDARIQQHKENRSYVFIDEISTMIDWQHAILELSNMGVLDNCAIVAIGSNAIDLRLATECLIGRKGHVPGGNHRSLLPMRFLDCASLFSPMIGAFLDKHALRKKASRATLWKSLVSGQDNPALSELDEMSGELDLAFRRYAVSGGLPHIVSQITTTGKIDDEAYCKYAREMTLEWIGMGYDKTVLKKCANFVIESAGESITWNSMSERLGIADSAAAKTHAMALADMYVAHVSYMYDMPYNGADYHMPKKLRVRDPFIFHVLNSWEKDRDYHAYSLRHVSDEANMGKLAECAVADHLASFALASSTGVMQRGSPERVCHWKDRSGREVDFVYRGPGSDPVPIGVKYVDRVDSRGLGGIASFVVSTVAERGIVATRAGYEIRRDYTLVPVPALLLLLS